MLAGEKSAARIGRVVLIGVLLVAFGTSACRKREANEYNAPEAALTAMFAAFSSADVDPARAWSFIGPDTRRRLESIVATSGLDVEPVELVEFGWVPDEALIRDVERVSSSGDLAVLAVTTELGDSFEVQLQRQERGWTVELGEGLNPRAVAPPQEAEGTDIPTDAEQQPVGEEATPSGEQAQPDNNAAQGVEEGQ